MQSENGQNDAPIIEVKGVTRTFRLGTVDVLAVRNVDLSIPRGRFITLVGRSGSGKTTLLNLMAGLDTPTSGTVLFEGQDISKFGERQVNDLRRRRLGIVFQSFALLPLLSAYENVELPLRISGVPGAERVSRAQEVLEMVGLGRRANHRPFELSGGEQQRVSIARAMAMRPDVLLADEPTGELDSDNAGAIFGLFREMVDRESHDGRRHDARSNTARSGGRHLSLSRWAPDPDGIGPRQTRARSSCIVRTCGPGIGDISTSATVAKPAAAEPPSHTGGYAARLTKRPEVVEVVDEAEEPESVEAVQEDVEPRPVDGQQEVDHALFRRPKSE